MQEERAIVNRENATDCQTKKTLTDLWKMEMIISVVR